MLFKGIVLRDWGGLLMVSVDRYARNIFILNFKLVIKVKFIYICMLRRHRFYVSLLPKIKNKYFAGTSRTIYLSTETINRPPQFRETIPLKIYIMLRCVILHSNKMEKQSISYYRRIHISVTVLYGSVSRAWVLEPA
jgi:hypothetical protein